MRMNGRRFPLCSGVNASSRLGGEHCEPTVRLPDWSKLVASYSRMKSAWGWANGGQPILVCYIRKCVIILGGDIPVDVSPTKILGDVSPAGLTPVPLCQYPLQHHIQIEALPVPVSSEWKSWRTSWSSLCLSRRLSKVLMVTIKIKNNSSTPGVLLLFLIL